MKQKQAQDILEQVRRGLSKVPGMASDAGGAIKNWYENLNPEARNAVMRGLVGAGVGGALTGGVAAMGKHDPEEKRPVLGPALLGALLGGGAAAGIPYGMKLLGNEARFPGEEKRPMAAGALEALGAPFVTHPATTAGGILGGGWLYKTLGKQLNPVTGKHEPSAASRAWRHSKRVVQPAPPPPPPSAPRPPLAQDLKDLLSKQPLVRSDALKSLGGQGAAGAKATAQGAKTVSRGALNAIRRALFTIRATPANRGKAGLLALPALLGAGAITDQYLKGDY